MSIFQITLNGYNKSRS